MSGGSHRNRSAALKAKVAIEVLRDGKTVAEIARDCVDAPMRRPHSAADSPRRRRCGAVLLALKRVLARRNLRSPQPVKTPAW
jgi:hypothetical protein